MLRGTNRSIIEINETEHKYFERVLIFVKPEFGYLPINQLEKEASRFVDNISFTPLGLKRRTTARQRAERIKKRKIAVGMGISLIATALLICLFKLI